MDRSAGPVAEVCGGLMKATSLLAETLLVALLAMPMLAQVTPADQKVACRNYKDVLALFECLGYTQKAWQAGIREIPRVYLEDVPDTWHERSAKELSVADKRHRRPARAVGVRRGSPASERFLTRAQTSSPLVPAFA
jgi:hypothetical protein